MHLQMNIPYEKLQYKLSSDNIKSRKDLLLKVLEHSPEAYLWAVDLVDNYYHRFPSKINDDLILFCILSICDDYATYSDKELVALISNKYTLKEYQKYRTELIKDLNMSFLRDSIYVNIINECNDIIIVNYICICLTLDYDIIHLDPNDWYSEVINFVKNYPNNDNNKLNSYLLTIMNKYRNLDYVDETFGYLLKDVPDDTVELSNLDCDDVYLIKLDTIEYIPYNRNNMIEVIDETGGNGKVYSYEHNGKAVAVKKFKHKGLRMLDLQEIIYLMRYKHENIIDVKGYGIVGNYLYLFIEQMDSDLTDKTLDYNKKSCIQQILKAVIYLHNNNIIHKDLKPNNVLYSKSTGKIKLIDFGLSVRHTEGTSYFSGLEASTLFIIPPDVLMGNEYYGLGFDIWSCAVTIAYILDTLPFFNDLVGKYKELYYAQQIFNVLGSPSESEWKHLNKFTKRQKFKESNFVGFNNIEPKYADLLYKMMKYVEKDRCTAQFALTYVNNFC
jgi:hypothetical protein